MKKWPLHLLPALTLYLLSFLWVSPFYEYPIGDDWTYAKVAKHFYETGSFQILPWYGQSLVAQVVWGFLFLLPFGFSFSALHLSNAVLGVLLLLFLDLLMESFQFQKRERLWGAVVLVASPTFIFVSRTFYTDLSFLAFYLGGAWAYAEGISRRSTAWLLTGSLLVGVSLLVRQVGLFLPLLLFFFLLRDRKAFSVWQTLTPLVPFVLLGGFTLWQYRYFHGIPPANLLLAVYALRLDEVLSRFLWVPFVLLLYYGYFLSPLLAPAGFHLWRNRRRTPLLWHLFLWGMVLLGLIVWILGVQKGLWMPDYLPKGFHLQGGGTFLHFLTAFLGVVGAGFFLAIYYPRWVMPLDSRRMIWIFIGVLLVTLGFSFPFVRSGLLSIGESLLPSLYAFFSKRIYLYQSLETWQGRLPLLYDRFLLRLFGILFVGTFLLVVIPLGMKKEKSSSSLGMMEKREKLFHAASFLYLLFLLFIPVTTDRYLFPLLPSAILLTLRAIRPVSYHTLARSLLVMCVLALSLCHADRTLQRVGKLWEGGHWLLGQGIPAEKIDGGFVFNSWHLYEKRRQEGFEGTDRGWREGGWWVEDPEYRVTPRASEAGVILRTIPYRDFITPSPDHVYVGRRK